MLKVACASVPGEMQCRPASTGEWLVVDTKGGRSVAVGCDTGVWYNGRGKRNAVRVRVDDLAARRHIHLQSALDRPFLAILGMSFEYASVTKGMSSLDCNTRQRPDVRSSRFDVWARVDVHSSGHFRPEALS